MGNKTKTGLILLIIAIILSIISNILLLAIDDIALSVSALGGIGGLLALIGIIFMILGRKEYGEKHRKFVIYALIFFILTIVLPIIISIIGISTAILSKDFSALGNIMYITPVSAILGGIAYILLLYELENKTGRFILYLAFAISIITSIFIAINITPIFEDTLGTVNIEDMSTQEITELSQEFSQKISKISAYGIFQNIILLIAIILPYNRISSGELASLSKISSQSYDTSDDGTGKRVCTSCRREIPSQAIKCPYCGK